MPPNIAVKEAYDAVLVDNMMQVARSLGIDTKRLPGVGGGAWGRAMNTGDLVKTRFAGPESVLAHEIGHILGFRYKLFDWMTMKDDRVPITRGKHKGELKPNPENAELRETIRKELRDLADLAVEGVAEVPESFQKYIRKGVEKEARMLEAWIHAPEKFKATAPTVYGRFEAFLHDHSELHGLIGISPSLVLGSGAMEIPVPGVTTLGEYYAPEPVARIINNYLSPGLRNSGNWLVSGAYDALRMAGNTLVQAEHALSLFHAINTSFDMANTSLGLGLRQVLTPGQRLAGVGRILTSPLAPVVNLWEGNRLLKAYSQDLKDITDPRVRKMIEAVILAGGRGRMDPQYHNHAVKALQQSIRDVVRGTPWRKLVGALALPVRTGMAAFELAAKPVMEWLVPRQKFAAFSMMAAHEFQRHKDGQITGDQLWERLRLSWASVDNRMGQLVYDNLFWNKTLKDSLMLAFRSVGWNLGSIREFGGGLIDVATTPLRVKRGDQWISERTAYTIGAVINYAAVGAVLTYLLTGRPPDDLEDYFFPPTGFTNPDGSPERLNLPTYAKDWYAWVKRPGRTVVNKLNPVVTRLSELWLNEDFFGTQVRDPQEPWFEQLKDVTRHIGKGFESFSFRNYQKMRRTGGGKLRSVAVSVTGITSAPAYLTRSPAMKLMLSYLADQSPQGARSEAAGQVREQRGRIRNAVRQGREPLPEDMYGLTADQVASAMAEGRQPMFGSLFKRLSLGPALNVFSASSDEERAHTVEMLRQKFYRANRERPDFEAEQALYGKLMGSLSPAQRAARPFYRPAPVTSEEDLSIAFRNFYDYRALRAAEKTAFPQFQQEAARLHAEARRLGIASEPVAKKALASAKSRYTALRKAAAEDPVDKMRYTRARAILGD